MFPSPEKRSFPRNGAPVRALLVVSTLVLALAAFTRDPTPRAAGRVEFARSAYAGMQFLYRNIRQVEWAVCLDGEVRDSSLVIDRVTVPYQVGNAPTSIGFADCRGHDGIAHSHPGTSSRRVCTPSEADLRYMVRNGYGLMVIWCGEDSFRWVMRRNGEVTTGGWNDFDDRSRPITPYPTEVGTR